MNAPRKICAVVPVKDTQDAKQRLAAVLSGARRQELALAMFEDVLAALARVPELAGILVVTIDPAAAAIAARHGAQVSGEGARDGHTGAVTSAAQRLATEGLDMLALPGDIPLVEADDIRQIIAAHAGAFSGKVETGFPQKMRPNKESTAPAFTIVPARDERGSNAVLCSPAGAVPLRFGDDSFFPHLDAAKARGIAPTVVQLPRIALDIDTPDDLTLFLRAPAHTRAHALLARWRVHLDQGIKAPA
jgi:2-phospho-L-lactate guanylyltransferase